LEVFFVDGFFNFQFVDFKFSSIKNLSFFSFGRVDETHKIRRFIEEKFKNLRKVFDGVSSGGFIKDL
jgi:hypothetical protein